MPTRNSKIILISIALTIFIIALFLRFYKITTIPPGLYPDEAMNGVNALEAIDTGDYKIFYPENNGREGLFINIQSIFVRYFGNTPWALRMVSGIFGALTVLGVFFLAYILFRKNPNALLIATLSALFMAFGFWHLNFSRIGFRAITMPFFTVFSLIFLFLALKKWENQWLSLLYFTLSGILLGLGVYGYTPFRLIPLLFATIFLALFWYKKFSRKTLAVRFGLLIFVSILVFSPLALDFLHTPQDFSNRNNKIYFFQQDKPLDELGIVIARYALLLNIRGDCNSRHNQPCWPELNPFISIAFLIGLIGFFFKKMRMNITIEYAWILLFGLLIGFLPGILASEGAPHALRTIGMTPFAYIIAGFGTVIIYERIKKYAPLWRNAFLLLLFIFLISALGLDSYRYFYVWAKSDPDFSQNFVSQAGFLKSQKGFYKYIIANSSTGVTVNGFPTTIMTSKYLLWQEFQKKNLRYVTPEQIATLSIQTPAIILSLEPDALMMNALKAKFPQGETKEISSNLRNFSVFVVK